MCKQNTESMDPFVSGSLILIPIEYKYKMGHYIHMKVCKYNGILNCEKYHNHQPEQITEAKGITFL